VPTALAVGALLVPPRALADDANGDDDRLSPEASTDAAAEEPEEIVVAGQRPHPTRAAREPAASSFVLRGERLLQPGTAVADALREAPGVQVTQLGALGGSATASLRGATAAQTPIYLGGVRINDEIGGAANLADVPLFLIDRVEVYRSHAPRDLELGVGGAVLFEPKRPRGHGLSLGVHAGAFGARGAQGYAMAGSGGRGALAAFELSAADNDYSFHDDRGTVFVDGDDQANRLRNADAHLRRFWLLADERIGSAELRFLLHHGSREQGAPKLVLTPTHGARVRNERDLVAVTSRVPVEPWDGAVELSTAATMSTTWLDDPLGELSLVGQQIHTPGEHLEQRVRATQRFDFGLVLSQQLTVSTERLRRFERRAGSPQQILAARRLTARPTLSAELPLGAGIVARGTAAARCVDTSRAELQACRQLLPEGRVSLSRQGQQHEMYVSAGRYQRLPTLTELYGASLLVQGNASLRAERGDTVEAGVRWQGLGSGPEPLLWIDAAAFARWSSDLILYTRTAQGYLIPQNRMAARSVGAELTAGVSPTQGLELSGNVSWIDARDVSPTRTLANDVLPFISPMTASGLVSYTATFEDRAVDEATVGLRALHQSSRFADAAGLGVIPEQTWVDLELAARALSRQLVVRGRIANLFDARRFDVVGFPLPGRSAFMSLEATW
jgi:vitamin B12 transporter